MSQAASRGEAEPQIIRHEFADVNGMRLHYAIAQPGAATGVSADGTNANEAKLIVFLHGFPEFWYAWRKQLVEFGRDFIAVAPDMRGYNLSSKPSAVEEYEAAKLVGDVRALIEHIAHTHHLRANTCCLVGHDWGGVVSWCVAMSCPEVVDRLIIINAPHPKIFARELRENPAQQEASQYMLVFRSAHAETMMSANRFALMQESILGEGICQGYILEADRAAYVEAWSQPGALTGGLNYYRAAEVGPTTRPGQDSLNFREGINSFEVKMPTLVIWGEKDPYLLSSNLNGLDRYVPNLKVERIPDATHWVVHEKSERVNRLIREFLAT